MTKTNEVHTPTTVDINLADWSVELRERTRNKIEAQAFKNFAEVVKPDEISSEDFLKSIFKIGLEEMENRLMSAVEKHAEDNNIDMDALKKDDESNDKEQS